MRNGAKVVLPSDGVMNVTALEKALFLHVANLPTSNPFKDSEINNAIGGAVNLARTDSTVQAIIESGADIGRRSPLENLLSLFDEGGAVVISSDESLLQMVRDFHWKSLFWQQREALQEKLTCIVFGHAMYEKGLEPYIGMTANAILLHCDETFFQLSNEQQLAWVDEALLVALADREQFSVPKDLSPFPILGMPGWDANNGDEAYYDNQRYFRPGRGGAKAVA
ncbi:MAG: hypothetical protein COB71_07135 [Thiotrichales bacterium]|nr:MAG: hypothetical protein COB71_07135 [Thiotrichales bacterium]